MYDAAASRIFCSNADAALADAQEQLDRAILEATDSGRGLHLDEERTCVVCYDDFLGFSDGVECDCADAHFVCNECFVASVRSSITDTPAKQALRDGHIYCPYATFPPTQHSCKSGPYDDRVVATKVDSALFDEYQKVQESLVEARVAKEAEIALEIKIAAAMKKMEEMGAKVFKAQKFIVDDILTMHCPRCKTAFVDWDGCNSLYCTVAGCGCNFCAFCLADCGADAHPHLIRALIQVVDAVERGDHREARQVAAQHHVAALAEHVERLALVAPGQQLAQRGHVRGPRQPSGPGRQRQGVGAAQVGVVFDHSRSRNRASHRSLARSTRLSTWPKPSSSP